MTPSAGKQDMIRQYDEFKNLVEADKQTMRRIVQSNNPPSNIILGHKQWEGIIDALLSEEKRLLDLITDEEFHKLSREQFKVQSNIVHQLTVAREHSLAFLKATTGQISK